LRMATWWLILIVQTADGIVNSSNWISVPPHAPDVSMST
jgi:hypothetical protein